jgi:predicted transcriptional regulator
MRTIPCPVSRERLADLYEVQKLTDQKIVDLLIQEGHDLGDTAQTKIKRVRSWRCRFGIQTLPRWSRNEVPPIEGPLRSLLVGSMLGDGRLVFRGRATSYEEFHCAKQLPYLKWKHAQWGPKWSPGEIKPSDSGARFGTVAHASLNDYQALFYGSRERGWKRLVPEVVDLVDARALAIWYLDDGSAGWWPSICFGAGAESMPVAWAIFEKFGLKPTWKPQKQNPKVGYFTMMREEVAERFLEIVAEHVPDCMSYKMEFGFRGLGYRLRQRLSAEVLRPYVERGTPIKQIARELGESASTVDRYLDRAGLTHPRLRGNPDHRKGGARRRTQAELDAILTKEALVSLAGRSVSDMAQQLGACESTVVRYLQKHGLR